MVGRRRPAAYLARVRLAGTPDLQLKQRIALIGFDDIMLADLVRPAITVMAQDPSQLGTLAAERLFARLDGDTCPVQTVVVAAKLVVRGSGEIPPADR